MGGKNVKNTIIERLMQLGAPHLCFGCGKVGSLLCQYCKYDIVSEPFAGCFLCAKPTLGGVCDVHQGAVAGVFIVGARHDTLKELVNGLKFRNMKAAAVVAAELLHDSIPTLPNSTVVVPIPTVRAHVRQRGHDHAELIARHFAYLRGLPVKRLLERSNSATQHTLGRADRIKEAEQAFTLTSGFEDSTHAPKLIIDDIITTGSTIQQAAQLLSQNGSAVIVGALAYQPLD